MLSVTTHEAKTQLSRLIARVEQGEEVLICRGNVPAARLVPVASPKKVTKRRRRPRVGTVTSPGVTYTADAFAPMTDTELAEWGL